MNYTALYQVEIYDDITGANIQECGILYADTFADAMTKIEEYYGSDNIVTVHHLCLYDTSMFTFSTDILPTIKKVLED